MRRGPGIGTVVLALACALALALVLAATASAAPAKRQPEYVFPPDAFTLQASNGFTVSGSFYQGEPGAKHGIFAVSAIRGGESVVYAVPAQVTEHSVRAKLGHLGRVDLRLRLSGEEASAKLPCSNESITYEPGTLEGTFEFHGEGGFTRARGTTLAAIPQFSLAEGPLCESGFGEELGGRALPGARLKGVSFAGGRTLKFQLNKNKPGSPTLYSASVFERHGAMRIHREVTGEAAASAFRFDKSLRTVTVSPPAPFSGKARITRSRNAVSPYLTGDLELAFLGRTVPLAGPAVHVGLEHARRTRGEEGRTVGRGI